MTDELMCPEVSVQASQRPNPSARNAAPMTSTYLSVGSGSLRIAGDPPIGLVMIGTAPAARIVDLFARDLIGIPFHVARTVSAANGTYEFTGLPARDDGYDVCIRGVIAAGERDLWIPGVHPG